MRYLILIKFAVNVAIAIWLARHQRWALFMMFSGFSLADMGSMLAI